MFCLCPQINGNGTRIEKGFEERGASSASCGRMFSPNPGFGCPGTVLCWADGTLPVFSQQGLNARCGTSWGSADEPFRSGGEPGATVRVEASSSHSTERMGLGVCPLKPLSHSSHPQPFVSSSCGERGVRERDSGAGFSSGVTDIFLQFLNLKMRKLMSTLTMGRSLKNAREKLYKVLFSVYPLKSSFWVCIQGRGEWHKVHRERESQYTQPGDSPQSCWKTSTVPASCWIVLSGMVLARIAQLTLCREAPDEGGHAKSISVSTRQYITSLGFSKAGHLDVQKPHWRHTRSPAFPCTRKTSSETWVGVQLQRMAPSMGFAPRGKEPCWCSAMKKSFAHGYSAHQELHCCPASQSITFYGTLKTFIFLYEFKVYYLPTWHTWALSILLWVSALYLALLARVLAKFCL